MPALISILAQNSIPQLCPPQNDKPNATPLITSCEMAVLISILTKHSIFHLCLPQNDKLDATPLITSCKMAAFISILTKHHILHLCLPQSDRSSAKNVITPQEKLDLRPTQPFNIMSIPYQTPVGQFRHENAISKRAVVHRPLIRLSKPSTLCCGMRRGWQRPLSQPPQPRGKNQSKRGTVPRFSYDHCLVWHQWA